MTYWQRVLDWFNAKSNTQQGFILVGVMVAFLALLALFDAMVS